MQLFKCSASKTLKFCDWWEVLDFPSSTHPSDRTTMTPEPDSVWWGVTVKASGGWKAADASLWPDVGLSQIWQKKPSMHSWYVVFTAFKATLTFEPVITIRSALSQSGYLCKVWSKILRSGKKQLFQFNDTCCLVVQIVMMQIVLISLDW